MSKQSVTRSVKCQSEELQKEIKREMEVVASETDIAFTTNFWMSPTHESFMMISMHWITQDWSLKTRIFGMMRFPKNHGATKISDKLMDLHLESDVYPKNNDGRSLQYLDVVRLDKLLYFTLEPLLDKPVLTSDCGSDVLMGAEKESFEIQIFVLSSSRCERSYDRGLFGTFDDIARVHGTGSRRCSWNS